MTARDPVELEQRADGVVLPVRAQPRARRNGIAGVHGGRLKVLVTQPPEKGKANGAIIKVLAAELSLKSSRVCLLSGATSSQKRFLIEGATLDDLHQRIASCLK